MNTVKIAFTKGRLEKITAETLGEMGYDTTPLRDKGRKLIFNISSEKDNLPELQIVLVKAPDVITYVEHGVCDLGVTGKDVILEQGGSFFEIADLGFGKCRFSLAVLKGADFFAGHHTKTIATKYPNVTREYFRKLGMDVNIIKIDGSVELAPVMGLADGIVDIVETGNTLRENGLEITRDISDISAGIIANTVSLKMNKKKILEFIDAVKAISRPGRESIEI